jgi:hypothetical protein
MLMEVSARLERQGFSEELLEHAFLRIEEIPIETDGDRLAALDGTLRLMDILLPAVPKDMAADFETGRLGVQARLDAYGQNSPYAATVRITAWLAEALQQEGADAAAIVAQANVKLANLSSAESAESSLVRLDAPLRVIALQLAHTLLQKSAAGEKLPDTPLLKIVYELAESLRRDGFSKGLVLQAAEALQQNPPSTPALKQTLGLALLHVWGLGLLWKPDAGPALEPLRNRIIELDEQWTAESGNTSVGTRVPEPPTPCGIILDEFAATLERDGYSDYALQEATNAIQALPQETVEDHKTIYDGLLRMMELALTYAPKEVAQSLKSSARLLQAESATFGDRKFTSGGMRAQCQDILEELRHSLKTGELQGPAVTQAILKLSLLGFHVQDDSDDEFKILMKTMTNEFWEVLRRYVPEGSENRFQEVLATMGVLDDAVEMSDSDDQIRKAAFETQAAEQFGRLSQVSDVRRLTKITGLSPHTVQFLELLPLLSVRSQGSLSDEENEGDKAEIERMHKRYDAAMRMLAASTTEDQIIRHQREGIRRVALEVGRFERRHHLMLLHPAFPTHSVTINPNEVFFSGTDSVGDLVRRACATIEMDLVGKRSVQNPIHERWQQLRASALAIFDYSAYDPALADPTGAVDHTVEVQTKVLDAAGPVASVAYENGWAFVLGSPMVIVARKGQAVPFDIDLEPVMLEGDDQDVDRIVSAMQKAIYGEQRGIAGDCLADTVNEVRRIYGHDDDPQVRSLLAALTDVNDATRVRQVLAAVMERIEGGNPLLALPAFLGSYPSADHRELFHISAFREWSKSLQQTAKEACERAGIKYGIGFERLNPDIFRVIWTDICRASFVIADITNLNPNAVLELAMAQALGRPTLILTQNTEAHKHFPALKKVRIHQYRTKDGLAELGAMLDRFLAAQK